MALEKCPKCGRMHYRTDPCITVTPSKKATVIAPLGHVAVVKIASEATIEEVEVHDAGGIRTVLKDRHPPGYMANYMRTVYRPKQRAKRDG